MSTAPTEDFTDAEARIAMALAEAGYPGAQPRICDVGTGVRVAGVGGIPVKTVWRAAELARIGFRRPLCLKCVWLSTDPFTDFRANALCAASAPLTEDCGIDRSGFTDGSEAEPAGAHDATTTDEAKN